MKLSRWILMLSVALVLAGGAAACSDDKGDPKPTPGITTVGQRPTTNAIVTPFPTPQVTNNQVDSSTSKGYAATFPEGWNFYPNRIQTTDASVDVIFEPLVAGATAQANIAIECIVTNNPQSDAHITFEATKVARIGTNNDIVITQRQISGLPATVLTYHFESPNEANIPPLEKQDVIFSAGKCDWKLTTTAPQGQREKYEPQFAAFLDSFQLK
jgi:hypothetical protein